MSLEQSQHSKPPLAARPKSFKNVCFNDLAEKCEGPLQVRVERWTPEGSVAFLTGEADREKRFRVNVQAAD